MRLTTMVVTLRRGVESGWCTGMCMWVYGTVCMEHDQQVCARSSSWRFLRGDANAGEANHEAVTEPLANAMDVSLVVWM